VPYTTIAELPPSVRRHLPEHAQEIYRGAFNNAWQSYAADLTREEISHRVAWAAVKRRYRKAGAAWVPIRDAYHAS
jgi:cation transport regulator